jgi:hypothetical protein
MHPYGFEIMAFAWFETRRAKGARKRAVAARHERSGPGSGQVDDIGREARSENINGSWGCDGGRA